MLVVGSGYSGLAAAIEAKNAGADVKIIEKMNRMGGNSAYAAGDMAVCGSKVQAHEGIEDSVDAFVSDMLIAGLYLNDEEKCRLIAEKPNETWEWSVEMGCTWDKDENGEPWLYPYGGTASCAPSAKAWATVRTSRGPCPKSSARWASTWRPSACSSNSFRTTRAV